MAISDFVEELDSLLTIVLAEQITGDYLPDLIKKLEGIHTRVLSPNQQSQTHPYTDEKLSSESARFHSSKLSGELRISFCKFWRFLNYS